MAEWKDATNYRRGEARIPTVWEARFGELRIVVTCAHIYYRGKWVMHCAPWFDTCPLGADVTTAELAQMRALDLVRAKARSIVDALYATPTKPGEPR